jgi:glycerol-3-phosphate dehydrogenase
MLHSGGRYAVKDPTSASECAVESKVLKKIASFCIEDVGGLFVSLPKDDQSYLSVFLSSCRSTGVEAHQIGEGEALKREPNLNQSITAAVEVPDASIDPFFLAWGNVLSARETGATVLNHAPVRFMTVEDSRITSVTFGDGKDQRTVHPEMVVNAAGAWCGRIANMASVDLPVQMDKGAMVVLNGRIVNSLVNRLRPPSDGDILVPHRTSTILGTTSAPGDVDRVAATREEVEKLVHQAREVLPGIGEARMIRAYAGVRPLHSEKAKGREATRSFRIIDHEPCVDNLLSVVGGKLTTYRLMAEKASDLVVSKLGRAGACRTMVEEIVAPPLPGRHPFHVAVALAKYGGRANDILATGAQMEGEEACGCEAVSYAELEHFASSDDVKDLGDLMRRTRAGMGSCQGGLCAFRMASVLEGDPISMTEQYLRSRWKGIDPVLQGEQLHQEAFKAHLFRVYGIDHTSGGGT